MPPITGFEQASDVWKWLMNGLMIGPLPLHRQVTTSVGLAFSGSEMGLSTVMRTRK